VSEMLDATLRWDEIPTGTYVYLRADSTVPVVLFHATRYEIAPDGDLIVASGCGNLLQVDAGYWCAIGTLERVPEGGSYIALERFADEGPS
jgi:hypothetical protein